MSQEVKHDDRQPSSEPELPPFTLKNLSLDVYHGIIALVESPETNRVIVPIVITLASIATKFIISKVPYTEIDFSTYMQQIEVANEGELDYSLIKGDTGPAVYPAGFIQVYQWLHWITEEGSNINTGQTIFGYLFTFSVLLCCVAYTMVPNCKPWPIYLLLLSKRLYSIYVLRLFNDVFTTISMIGVVVLLQQASYWYKTGGSRVSFLFTLVAADLYSLGLSVKMNALLYLPGFIIIAYFLVGENMLKLLSVILVIPFVQVMIGWKYLLPLFNDEEAKYLRWTYINQAFNFKRKFLYKWTVNWRFVPEDIFLNDNFARILLFLHVSVLLIFVFTRYLSPKITGKSITNLVKDALCKPFSDTISTSNKLIDYDQGPKLVLLIFATSNLIGVLFSRSLHYQFLSWYCWNLPFLIFATGINVFGGVFIFVVHEWCWNVFPSTESSSACLISILSLLLLGVWYNLEYWTGESNTLQEKKEQ